MSVGARVGDYASLIKLSHSVFALPFALIALLVATDGAPGWALLGKIVLAMVFARSAAMAFNRWADRAIDARNPRTAEREIPSGTISASAALAFTVVCCVGFVATAGWIATICFWLSFPVLAVLLGYSYAKRFTSAVHVWLGVALGLAPPAAWVAATGAIDPSVAGALVLGLGVTLWVAGFDVLYACQDVDFDGEEGLRSMPVALGVTTALRAAQLFHVFAVAAFVAFGLLVHLGWPYMVGVGLAALLLVHEHRLLRGGDLSRIDAAFFTMNGLVSLALLAFTVGDIYL